MVLVEAARQAIATASGREAEEIASLAADAEDAVQLAAAGGVWVDRSSTAPLPPPQALARYALVLTTSERLSREGGRHKAASSKLRNVRWLRLVVDEGHVLGNAGLSHKVCR